MITGPKPLRGNRGKPMPAEIAGRREDGKTDAKTPSCKGAKRAWNYAATLEKTERRIHLAPDIPEFYVHSVMLKLNSTWLCQLVNQSESGMSCQIVEAVSMNPENIEHRKAEGLPLVRSSMFNV
jgi:hypothetical protein